MCGLCGVLGVEHHWTEIAGSGRSVNDEANWRSRRQERRHRVAISNVILAAYGLELKDWQGSAYLLTNRKGRTEMVAHLAALWSAAETLVGRPCDPLDPELIAVLERSD